MELRLGGVTEEFFHITKLSFMCISFVPGEINISVSSTKFMTKA